MLGAGAQNVSWLSTHNHHYNPHQTRRIKPAFSGYFSGKITAQAMMLIADQPNHEIGLAEVRGTQKSSDEKWNQASITYWAVTELSGGQGAQRGYFDNLHADGGRDFGTFEGKVSTSNGQMVCEGTWKSTGGTGAYSGIHSSGKFKTKVTSPTEVECSWDGTYELAAAKGAR